MSALDLYASDPAAATRVLNQQANSLITASVAVGYVLTEWSYHIEWESADIWPRILFPFLAWATTCCTSAWTKLRALQLRSWFQQRAQQLKRRTGAAGGPAGGGAGAGGSGGATQPSDSGATPSASLSASDKSIPEWALRSRPLLPSRKPLNGPEWAYVLARIGSIGAALASLAVHTVGALGARPADADADHRWDVPDRNCSAALRLTALFNLFALSGSGAIVLVRALALHKFQRPLEKPILWLLWGSIQALILLECISNDAVSSRDGSRVCVAGGDTISVHLVVILLPYFLPILSTSLCLLLVARYMFAYRRSNPEAWRVSWTFRLYLRDSFQYWLLSMALFLPLLLAYIIQQSTTPGFQILWSINMDELSNQVRSVVDRWRLTAILNLCPTLTAAYACRIFVNLRRCLEHDLGGVAAGGMGATAYEYTATGPGGGRGGITTGAASRLRSRQGPVRSFGAAAGFAGAGSAAGGPVYPYPYYYQYPYPQAQVNAIPIARLHAGSQAAATDAARAQSATTSQPIFSQISRIYGGEEAMATTHAVTPNWAGGPMGSNTGFGLGSAVGSSAAAALRVARRPSVGGGLASMGNQQPGTGTTAEGTSQVQFQLPGIHQQLAQAGQPAPGEEADIEKAGGEAGAAAAGGSAAAAAAATAASAGLRPYPQMYCPPPLPILDQQQHAAVAGSFIQAMNASGMPYYLGPSPSQQAPLPEPERQLVVVQEDWGDTHPDLVFSLNGGLDEEEEEQEEMQRQFQYQLQQQQQQQGYGMTPMGGATGRWWIPGQSVGLAPPPAAAMAVAAGRQLGPSHPHPYQASTTVGQQPHPQPQLAVRPNPAPPAEAEAEADTVAGDDESWMYHPEECECDGCCETDTEASDYVRPSPPASPTPASAQTAPPPAPVGGLSSSEQPRATPASTSRAAAVSQERGPSRTKSDSHMDAAAAPSPRELAPDR
ncbi:hypothetical protein OC844_003256 [Tilletia horrida]|nr:hypothetical protein OC844_003256 [Tilletia horrida]